MLAGGAPTGRCPPFRRGAAVPHGAPLLERCEAERGVDERSAERPLEGVCCPSPPRASSTLASPVLSWTSNRQSRHDACRKPSWCLLQCTVRRSASCGTSGAEVGGETACENHRAAGADDGDGRERWGTANLNWTKNNTQQYRLQCQETPNLEQKTISTTHNIEITNTFHQASIKLNATAKQLRVRCQTQWNN